MGGPRDGDMTSFGNNNFEGSLLEESSLPARSNEEEGNTSRTLWEKRSCS